MNVITEDLINPKAYVSIRHLIIQQKDLGVVTARQSQSLKRLGQGLGRRRHGQLGQLGQILIF